MVDINHDACLVVIFGLVCLLFARFVFAVLVLGLVLTLVFIFVFFLLLLLFILLFDACYFLPHLLFLFGFDCSLVDDRGAEPALLEM